MDWQSRGPRDKNRGHKNKKKDAHSSNRGARTSQQPPGRFKFRLERLNRCIKGYKTVQLRIDSSSRSLFFEPATEIQGIEQKDARISSRGPLISQHVPGRFKF
mmetsp:Transcript_17467/g.48228  ORF Transcript_17467/g.48228 Transcript_17467/m.48228 type:complete len:103 (-) Transcript_17467:271-579(-)